MEAVIRAGAGTAKSCFMSRGETLVAVSVSAAGDFSVGEATRSLEHPGLIPGGNYASYDVSADGQRFILAGQWERARTPPSRRFTLSKTGTKSSATVSRTKSPETNYIALVRG